MSSICATCTGSDKLRHICTNSPALQKRNGDGEVVECTGYQRIGSNGSLCETCTGNDRLRQVCVNGPDIQQKTLDGEVVECTGYKRDVLDPQRSYLEDCKKLCWESEATIPCPEVGMRDPMCCPNLRLIMRAITSNQPRYHIPAICLGCKHAYNSKCAEKASKCAEKGENLKDCEDFERWEPEEAKKTSDAVNHPSHYAGQIEVIDYNRDKLTHEEFTGFCMGNVIKYVSRWRKKDGIQDLKKAAVYLQWAIENEEKKK